MHVRIIVDGKQSPARNMAIDEALLRTCREPVLRFYQWNAPAVSIGYFQQANVVPEGRIFVRRYTGGGLVDHAQDFTYSMIFPHHHALYKAGTSCSYEIIHRTIAFGLADCGIKVNLAQKETNGDSFACFQKSVKFDVVSGLKKIAGAAQRRVREACLHQGSILAPQLNFDPLCNALLPHLVNILDDSYEISALTDEESQKALELEKSRYSTEKWNQHRGHVAAKCGF